MENNEVELNRGKQNTLIFQILYSIISLKKANQDFDIKEIISDICEKDFEECDFFIKEVVVKALSHQNEIEALIKENLNNWSYDRLSIVTLSCLFYAYSACKYSNEVEKTIAINNAVNFSKKYGDKKEFKFINAILDKTL